MLCGVENLERSKVIRTEGEGGEETEWLIFLFRVSLSLSKKKICTCDRLTYREETTKLRVGGGREEGGVMPIKKRQVA